MLLAPFLWPCFVAIIFKAFHVAVPFLMIGIAVRMLRREKPDEQKGNPKYKNTEAADIQSEETVSGQKTPAETPGKKADPVPERYRETAENSLRRQLGNRKEMSDAACYALVWYELEGKERILRLMRRLETEGVHTFSISPEGICSIREGKGYRRIGALRSYPGREMKGLIPRLKDDHIYAAQRGRYLWLSWGKERFR